MVDENNYLKNQFMWTMHIYIMNDHYIQKQQYNEYINELENLINIKYNHSFENGSLSGGVQPRKILYGVLVQQQCRLYGFDFLQDCSQKK
jgi:hypothetical protein